MNQLDAQDIAQRCFEICKDRKAEAIHLYDVRRTSLLADFYLICSGNSVPHIRAISGRLTQELGSAEIRPRSIEGAPASRWVVIDYGIVLVHIFHPELREFYGIEALWGEEQLLASAGDQPPEN